MKFSTLKSIAHNIADSLGSGIGLMIGIYEMHIFEEAAASPQGFIEVDFLTGETSGGAPSDELARAVRLYSEALPDLCQRQGACLSDFRVLKARFSGRPRSEGFTVTVEDQHGHRAVDDYVGLPGRRPKVLDPLGRVRRK